MTPAFSPLDPDTWPLMLTAEQVAAIYQRKVGGLRKSCQHNSFIPAPAKRQPYRWRKCDVIRDIEGGRTVSMRRAG